MNYIVLTTFDAIKPKKVVFNPKRIMKKYIFLYHIIYILFLNYSFSQNIHLKTKGTDSVSHTFLNKTNSKKIFADLKTLEAEIQKIQESAFNNGYFNAVFLPKVKLNDSTYLFKSSLNNRLENITIHYNSKQISTTELNHILDTKNNITPEYFTINTTTLESNLNNIIKHLTNKGQTFSYTRLTNINIHDNEVHADLNLNISQTNYISEIKIKGYKKFPQKFIKHFLRLKKEEALNLKDIEEKSARLNNLRFSNELKKPEILFSKDSSIIYLYIKKQKSNSFEGFLGFSTNPQTSKLDFNGNINLQLINNLNSGEELYLKYQSTENKQKRTNIILKLPYILNSPFSIEGELDIFKKDSSFTNNSQSILTKYTATKNIQIGTGIQFNSSNSLLKNNLNTEDYKKNSYLLSFNHQSPNKLNKLFPNKTKTHLTLSTSKRKTKLNNTSQQSIYLSSEYIFTLNYKNSFYLKSESYSLFSENILENELHYIGGINSIRGFKENSIPSSQYTIINSEYRIELSKSLYTHTVIDYAISKNNTTNNFNNLLGFGLGFGLRTNNSLLRFIFANSKSGQEKIEFSNSKIHLSLSTLF